MKRIHRAVLLVLALGQLGGFLALRAQVAPASAPAGAPGPRARFAEPSVNFGKVMPAEVQRHVFVVTNVGSAPLVIRDVAPGCGCTTTGTWDKEIAPGKAGRIPIEFNPANFSGVIHKSVVVTTNDPTQPTQVLDLQATVWRPFEIEPAFTSFLPVEGEAGAETKMVRILNHLGEAATLEPPQSNNPQFKAELKPVRAGREYGLHITYDPAVPGASPNAAITIKTSSAEQPLLTISAFAMPQPAVVVIPASIQLPAGPLGAGVIHNIVVRNNGGAALKVTDPAATAAGLRVTVSEPQPGKMFYVSVAFPAGYAAPAGKPAVVSVKTSHPRFPEIRVPIVPGHDAMKSAPAGTGK